jgi:multiple sugar transport system substrate-binding protein
LGHDSKGFYFPGRCAGCNTFTFLPLIWASGGDVLSEDGRTATINTPAIKDALEFYHRLWSKKLIPAEARVDHGDNFFSAFTSDKIGMMGSGTLSIATLKKQYPDIDFGIAYLPGKNGGTSSFAAGNSIAIPRGSKHVQEAFDFIQWALSQDAQVKILAKLGILPVRTDFAENEYSKLDPRYMLAARAMAQGHTPYSIHYNELFNAADGPWIGALQRAVFDGEIDEAMNTAQQQFTRILSSPL